MRAPYYPFFIEIYILGPKKVRPQGNPLISTPFSLGLCVAHGNRRIFLDPDLRNRVIGQNCGTDLSALVLNIRDNILLMLFVGSLQGQYLKVAFSLYSIFPLRLSSLMKVGGVK